MSKTKRRKFVVDRKVQGALAFRLVSYCLFTWFWIIGLTVGVTVVFGVITQSVPMAELMGRILRGVWLPLVLSLMALPVVIWDSIRTSNRFAGPVMRFRNAVNQLCDGETPDPIHLRKNDHWQELAKDFNRMVEQLSTPTEVARPAACERTDDSREECDELISC